MKASKESLEKAAQLWCKEETKHIEMITELAEAFAIEMDKLKTTENAFNIIKQAMIDDDPSKGGSLAHAWHCNVAMMCQDAIVSSIGQKRSYGDISNDAASRFMKLCFDVETQ